MYETLRSVIQFRELELDSVARRLRGAANIDDLRRIAQRRLPSGVFDYIDGAAEDELSLRRNTEAFRDITFHPRVLRDVSNIDTSTTVLGRQVPFPLIMAPTGFPRIAHPDGELAVARAAARAGVPFTLSTMGTRSIEEVRAANDAVDAANGRLWFQVYVWKDKVLLAELLERAGAAGYESIVITVDTAVLGRRERDVRRGFTLPPKIGLDTLVDGALHPGWTWQFARAEPIVFANIVGRNEADGSSPISLAEHVSRQFDPTLSWSDIDWFRERWSGSVVVKGIQTVDDARIAADIGVDAVALSNHGGRQLDSAPTPIELVAPVAEAVGDRVEIYCDGGVRRGSDVVKAIALGATACMVGRAHFFALAAGGERGVDWMLDFMQRGIAQTMALTGVRTIDEITPELVRRP